MPNRKTYAGGTLGNWAGRIRLVREFDEAGGDVMDRSEVMARWGVTKAFIQGIRSQLENRSAGVFRQKNLRCLATEMRERISRNVQALEDYGMTEAEACRVIGLAPAQLEDLRRFNEFASAKEQERKARQLERLERMEARILERAERVEKRTEERLARLDAKFESVEERKNGHGQSLASKLKGGGQDDFARRIAGLKVSAQTAGWLANVAWWNLYADDEPISGRLEKLANGFDMKRKLDAAEALDGLARLGWPRSQAVQAVTAAIAERQPGEG